MIKRICCLILALVMTVGLLPVMAQAESTDLPRVISVGFDSATKGAWEGVYGAEAAVLFGYNYTGNRDFSGSGGRFAYVYGDYSCDYVKKPENSPLVSYQYVTGNNGKLWTYAGTDESVLNMPAGSTLEKYQVYTSAGTLPYQNDPNNTDKAAWQRATFTFEMADEKYHQFSFYTNQTTKDPIYVTIVDKETKEILFEDAYGTEAFKGGAYVSYLIKGSFELYLDKTRSSDFVFGFSGFFVDAVNENETANLAATAGSTPADAALSWTESEAIRSDTKVIIERMAEGEETWETLAEVNSGVKQYTDSGLESGKTYCYRLKTVTGITHSMPGPVVEYMPGQVVDTPDVYKIGMDSATKGAWEGVYGAEAAVLFGYNYTGNRDFSGSGGRFAYVYGDYSCDYVRKPENSPLVSYQYVTGGKLWTYEGKDASVLNMPAGSTLEKYQVYTSAGTLPYQNDPNNTDKAAWQRATFTFEMADEKYHQFSFYTNQTTKDPIYVTIVDKETKEILFEDEYGTEAFKGGAYVSYLIKGSFELYLDKTRNSDFVFGFSGFFVDAVAENETSALSIVAGQEARSAVLTWEENEDVPAGTKILVERKAGSDGTWMQLAVVDSGVKVYQDTGLEAGTTYYYRLKSQSGVFTTPAGEEVPYTVPAYKATTMCFDRERYTAASCEEEITVKITLKDLEDVVLSGCTVKLQADFGHNVQEIAGVQTDESGVATFTFRPAYLGNATLTAIFEDDDSKQLMNSTVESALFVGQTQWAQAPVLYRISDGILPGDLISINGYGIKADDMSKVVIKCAPHTAATAPVQPPESAGTLVKIQEDERDGYYIVTQLPVDAQPGLYDIWVGNANGYSMPITLNMARPLFISEYEVWEGQSISVSGRNLQAQQFGADSKTVVRLRNGNGAYEQFLSKVTPYSIDFTVVNTPVGEYLVEVSNDGGISWRGLSSNQTLTVVEKGMDPLNIGYAWMDHFAWENRFDVTAYGADGTDTENDTAAVNAAIQAAKASNANGGIIYFPEGNYYLQGVQIPNNIVLLGESTEDTVLYYIGAGENMFENTDGIGHVGFARFSVKLAEDAVRPDTFFWLGHPWDASANDVAYRTASEIFLKEIDLTYGMTKEADMNRGLGVVALGQERITVQDCAFSGFAANMNNIRFNEYSGYYRIKLDFDSGFMQSTASYSFVEDCQVIGGLRKSGQYDNHGIFGHQSVHMENNYVEGVGSVLNDGEPYCAEAPTGNINYGTVINATANTVSFVPECGMLQNHYAISHGRLAVRITNGKGMGQQRDVASIDAATNTITLTEDWAVIPDSSCIVTLIVPLDNATIYNNVQVDSAKGTYLYGNTYDAVVANLTSIDSDGIYVHSSNVKGDRAIQSAFVTIRDNKLSGVSPRTNDVKIAVQTTRRNRGSEYFAVGIYGIEIRNNQLEGVRGAVSEAQNSEAPSGSGLISWAGVKGDGNTDGYCGDNTNVLMENNTLTSVDKAITTTLGDYGFVLKGNHFENVGEELSNTNTAGTGKLLVLDADWTKEVLQNYVDVWSVVKKEDYTQTTYNSLQSTLQAAKAVLAQPEATADSVAAALQEIRIASSALVVVGQKPVAQVGDRVFTNLAEAIEQTVSGKTITLLADTQATDLVLTKDITLDLNGYNLTADYLVAFGDGKVVDTTGDGLLKCANVRLAANNPMMPVWDAAANADGYRFFDMVKYQQYKTQDANGFVFQAKPALGKAANDRYLEAMDSNRLTVKARIYWKTTSENEVEQLFTFKPEDVEKAYQADDMVLQLTVTGAGAYAGKLWTSIRIESETGVIWEGVDAQPYTGISGQ